MSRPVDRSAGTALLVRSLRPAVTTLRQAVTVDLTQNQRVFSCRLLGRCRPGGAGCRVTVRKDGGTLMIVHYYPRTPGDLPGAIELTASRFELMPGVRPGVALAAAARVLGPTRFDFASDIGVENSNAPGSVAVVPLWEAKGCMVDSRRGPGSRVGPYAPGASETRRYRPHASIWQFEMAS